MAKNKIKAYKGVNISLSAIASVAGDATMECYGVTGLAPKNQLSDEINTLLKISDYSKGIYVKGDSKKGYQIGVYIYIANDVKITEVLTEVQKRVAYELKKTFSIPLLSVDVFVVDIKETN